MTTVINIKHAALPSEAYVYVGRPSKWGNPFLVEVHGRDAAIEQYREWIEDNPDLLDDLHELQGRLLGCFCAPLPCHADVLAELADMQ